MKNYKGEDRKIGIELEFYGLSPAKAAEILAGHFEVEFSREHDDLYEVSTPQGVYQLETDAALIKKLSQKSNTNIQNKTFDLDGAVKDVLSFATKEIVPTELISPPLQISEIDTIVQLQNKFKAAGAEGTTGSFRFAFAAQLNPEVRSIAIKDLLKEFKSFVMLLDWYKHQCSMDLTRQLTSFAADYPKKYLLKIFSSNYEPDLKQFMRDYLEHNPTRNRALDMLPLFKFIDPVMVDEYVSDERVNSRPTYHYRLPNSQLSLESWDISIEWSRWLVLEDLADSEALYCKMSEHYYRVLTGVSNTTLSNWLRELNNYVERLRR